MTKMCDPQEFEPAPVRPYTKTRMRACTLDDMVDISARAGRVAVKMFMADGNGSVTLLASPDTIGVLITKLEAARKAAQGMDIEQSTEVTDRRKYAEGRLE